MHTCVCINGFVYVCGAGGIGMDVVFLCMCMYRCVCVYVGVCMGVCVCVYASCMCGCVGSHACEGQRRGSAVPGRRPLSFLETGSPTHLELVESSRLAGQRARRSTCLCLLSTGVTRACRCARLLL